MLNTGQLRNAWGPPCAIVPARVVLFGGAPITVDHRAAQAFKALSACMDRHDYPATPTNPPTTGAYVCRAITGGTGFSLHAFGIAVDIRWNENPYQTPAHYAHGLTTTMPPAMVDEILGLRTNNGEQIFGWGGNYSVNKDPMHYEVVCTPADLATGIRSTTPSVEPPTIPPAPPQEIPVADVLIFAANSPEHPANPDGSPGAQWFIDATGLHKINTPEQTALLIGMRSPDFSVVDMPGDLTWYRDMVTTQ